ncbi:MAG TPA: XrtA system polysaccharide chain length determinant [Rhodanobacteraceae bacterium]|nr:XrtA system polysaccharide chain length determinant [Rhodanobacteraceae bacterium]
MSTDLVPANPYSVTALGETIVSEGRRRRLTLVVIFAVIALLALVAGVLWPKKFVSTTTILVQENNIIKPLTEGLAAPTAVADRAGIASEVIFSRKIMQQILTDGGWMASHPSPLDQVRLINEIKDRTSIDAPRENLLEISYADTDPRRAYDVTREMAQLFIQESLDSKERESTSAYEFMDTQVKEYQKKLDAESDKIKQFLETHEDAAPGNQVDTNTRIAQLRTDMETARMNIAELSSQSSTLGGQLSGQSEVSTVQTREGVYRAQIAELQSKLDQLKLTYTDSYPDVVRVRHQIEDLRKQLQQAEQRRSAAKLAGTPTAIDNTVQFNPVYQTLQTRQAEIQGNLAAARARLGSSSSQLESELDRSKRIAATADEMSQLSADYQTTQAIYQDLLKRRENARVSMELDRERRGLTFRIQDPAVLPLMPSGLRLMHFAVAGLALAVLIPVGLLFGIARFDPRARRGELLEQSTGLPVLATIPAFRTVHDHHRDRRRSILAVAIVVGVFLAYGLLYLIRVTGVT